MVRVIWNLVYVIVLLHAGVAFGAVEGCFLTPLPGDTSPMIYRTFGVMLRRSVLFGKWFLAIVIVKFF